MDKGVDFAVSVWVQILSGTLMMSAVLGKSLPLVSSPGKKRGSKLDDFWGLFPSDIPLTCQWLRELQRTEHFS